MKLKLITNIKEGIIKIKTTIKMKIQKDIYINT